jgi:hypothetical protein
MPDRDDYKRPRVARLPGLSGDLRMDLDRHCVTSDDFSRTSRRRTLAVAESRAYWCNPC